MSELKITISRSDDDDLDNGAKNFAADLIILLQAAGFKVAEGEHCTNTFEIIVERG